MEKAAEEMVGVLSIFLLASIKQYGVQFVSIHFQECCFDRALPTNVLQVELTPDCKMVSRQPELSRGRGYELSGFSVCLFGEQELWHLAVHISSQPPRQRAPGGWRQ